MQSFLAAILRMLRPGIGQMATHPPYPVSWGNLKINAKLFPRYYPRISIVIPSFNQGCFIEETLLSIIEQKYPNLELIVVDGGSTDNTLTVIKKYEAYIDWWVSEPDAGQVAAINKGLMRTTGDIMAWINSDDLVAPGAFHFVGEYFIKNPLTQVLYGNRVLINEECQEIGRWILPYHSDQVLKYNDFIPQETLYWTRKTWNLVGARLDENFQFAMDWDLLIRFSKKNVKIVHLPEFLGLFRVHKKQKTSSQLLYIGEQEMQKIRKRELGYHPTRKQLILNIIPFLLAAKYYEIRYRLLKSLGGSK